MKDLLKSSGEMSLVVAAVILQSQVVFYGALCSRAKCLVFLKYFNIWFMKILHEFQGNLKYLVFFNEYWVSVWP